MSQRAYAKTRGVSPSYINRLVQQGRLKLVDGKINKLIADKELGSPIKADPPRKGKGRGGRKKGQSAKESGSDYWFQKERHERIKCDLAELELRKKAGELIVAQEVEDELEKMLTAFRAKLLAMPTTLSPELSGTSEPTEIKIILDQAVEEVILELRSYDAKTGKFKDMGMEK